jgi:NADH dehydrogenase
MPEIPPRLAEFTTSELRARGIEVLTSTRVNGVEEAAVDLSNGERVPTRSVCWTAGVKPPAVSRALGLPLTDAGGIDCDEYTRVRGIGNVWAVGDAAAIPDPAQKREKPSPPTAQHALRQGKVAADNVAAALGNGRPRKFRYRTRGVFVDLGRNQAVAVMLGLKLTGFPAWFAARTYHLASMPGVGRRARLMVDWTVGLFFGRSSSELGQLGHPPDLRGYLDTPRHDSGARQ